MKLILEIQTGPGAGTSFILLTGRRVLVGRSRGADVVLPDDAALSALHFELAGGRDGWRLRDLGSATGTRVNGTAVREAALGPGDLIVAGRTTFAVRGESAGRAPALPPAPVPAPVPPAAEPPAPEPPPVTPQDRVLQALRGQPDPLFALLDAARDARVLEFVRGSGEEYRSLYEGSRGEELADWAPYLVRLPAGSGLLEALAREGWGKSWGLYLTSRSTLAEVRKHFRHFLMARLADGRDAYFRFYDPRVLRVYLPSCDPTEAAQFFGPVRCYLMEAKGPETLLRFVENGRGACPEAVRLAAPQRPGEV
jgi:hypothetical protein